jgi:hypothetical protein
MCLIKGNHSRPGNLIYHLPGMPYYDDTRAEAYFCTEAQAQAAGYRRAIVRQLVAKQSPLPTFYSELNRQPKTALRS